MKAWYAIKPSNLTLKPFNCVQANDLCLMELLVLNSNTLNYLTLGKQMTNI